MKSILNNFIIAFDLNPRRIRSALTILLIANIVSFSEANSRTSFVQDNLHRITSQNNFVILNGEEAQQFRLLGFLPTLQTFKNQVTLVSLTLIALIGSIIWLYAIGQRTNSYSIFPLGEDTLSHLPEPVARLIFYIQIELSAFCSVLLQDIMTIIHAPVGVGLNLASRLSGKGAFSSDYSSDDSYTSDILAKRSNGQSRRRRKDLNHNNNQVSTSKQVEGQHFAGIWNTGNSCFLNSTLQSIASVEEIKRSLETIIEQAELWDVPTPVTDALYDIVIRLNTASSSRHAIMPRQLTDALSNLPQTKVGSFFYAHQQQDAHELLVLATSAIDDEMNAVMTERREALRSYGLGLKAALAPLNRSVESNRLPFSNPFRALIAQRTACLDCGYVEAVRHYPTDELSLNVPARPGSAVTIEACLAHWSKLEVVDWICFRCSLIRTINSLKDEASYLEYLASQKTTSNSHTEPSSPSNSSKKKSGAKRRKAKEIRQKTEIIRDILMKGYSEDEVESKKVLQLHEIKLDRTFSRASTKQVMLARTPKVLVLHLNRSTYSASNFGASKNNAAVLFDDELDLSDFVTGGDLNVNGDVPISRGATPSIGEVDNADLWSMKGKKGKNHAIVGEVKDKDGYILNGNEINHHASFKKTRYRLCAIVVHYGNHSSGHYVSFRRRKAYLSNTNGLSSVFGNGIGHDEDFDISNLSRSRDQWYRISDDSVKKCTLEDVKLQNPFLMFYERLGDDADRLANSKTIENGQKVGETSQSMNGHHLNGDNATNLQNGLSKYSHTNGNNVLSRSQSDCRIPQGFEAIAQMQESALHGNSIRPRVFHRWESMPIYNGTMIKKEEIESDQIMPHLS